MSSFSFCSQPLLYPFQKLIKFSVSEAGRAKGTGARWEMAAQQTLLVSALRYLWSWDGLWPVCTHLGSISSFNSYKSLLPSLVSCVGPLHVFMVNRLLVSALRFARVNMLCLLQGRLPVPLSPQDRSPSCSVLNSSLLNVGDQGHT